MKAKIAAKWETIDKIFIRKNFPVMTWSELLAAVNVIRHPSQQVNFGALRHQVRRMGLNKFTLIRWSKEDTDYLITNYTTIGNVEMAAELNKRHTTFRVINGVKTFRFFTEKHVVKKLMVLGLHRTREEILKIRKRNLKTTNFKVITSEDNLWTQGKRKAYKEEEIRIWKRKRFIKINGAFTPYTRWFYHNFVEPVPEGHIVYHLDCDTLNDDPVNLACIKKGGIRKYEMYKKAIVLLAQREDQICEKLLRLNYDRNRDLIKQLHVELNRIRKLQDEINSKISKKNDNSNR